MSQFYTKLNGELKDVSEGIYETEPTSGTHISYKNIYFLNLRHDT